MRPPGHFLEPHRRLETSGPSRVDCRKRGGLAACPPDQETWMSRWPSSPGTILQAHRQYQRARRSRFSSWPTSHTSTAGTEQGNERNGPRSGPYQAQQARHSAPVPFSRTRNPRDPAYARLRTQHSELSTSSPLTPPQPDADGQTQPSPPSTTAAS